MISRTPELTDAGKALLMRALAGETLTFTRLAIGSGELAEGQNQDLLTELIHEELSITPASLDGSQEGLIAISGDFGSEDITEDFVWRELGVYAKGSEDNVELLYAYANDGDDAGTLRVLDTNILTEQTLTLIVEIDDAENVTAIYNPHTQYAESADLRAHTGNTSNPHGVTKAQVGLGNVPNLTPSNMTVSFTAADERANISTGEKLSVMFGKIAKVIADAIAHLTSTSNPHSVTKAQVGLGNVENTAPSNNVITFTEADEDSENLDENKDLFSGSTAGTLFGRVASLVHSALAHIGSTSNPHGVTKAQVGLGNVENTAPSFNVIAFDTRNSYAIPVSGETMATIMSKVAKDLTDVQTHMDEANNPNPHGVKLGQMAIVGTYTGDGTQGRTISTSFSGAAFDPSAVQVWDEFGRTYNAAKGVCGGLALASRGVRAPNSPTADDATTWSNSYTALMCVTGGFKVNFVTGQTAEDSIDTNENGVVYHYIAYK